MIAAFGELTFFVALAALALPAVVLGLTGRNLKYYGLFATVAMLGITLAGSLKQLALLGAFLVGETVLMKLHLWFITTHGNKNAWERRAAVVLALLPLILVKVTGLFHFPSLGFIGVSYLTFRAVQVIVEISDKLIKSQSVLDHLYFVAFFPTVSSGPIDRSRRFLQDAERRFKPGEYLAVLGRGLWLIVLGAFYKFALATLFAGWLRDLPDSRWGTVLYMYYYGFNLFFDFAGYSLMAVGASYLFGIRTPPELQAAVPVRVDQGLLEPLAHHPVVLAARLRLHPPADGFHAPQGVQGQGAGLARRAAGEHDPDGHLARQRVVLHRLRCLPRGAAGAQRHLRTQIRVLQEASQEALVPAAGDSGHVPPGDVRFPAVLGAFRPLSDHDDNERHEHDGS